MAEAALRATVRVHNGASSGTGWFVAVPGPDGEPVHVLVTAHHVFDAMKTPDCTLAYRAPAAGGSFVRKDAKVPIRSGDKQLWTRHPELDVAAIRVDVPRPMATVGGTVVVAGTSTAFEATVEVEVRQDGQGPGEALGQGFVMGGSNGEMGPFRGEVAIDPPASAAGAVLLTTSSAEDGTVQQATVVRVVFAGS